MVGEEFRRTEITKTTSSPPSSVSSVGRYSVLPAVPVYPNITESGIRVGVVWCSKHGGLCTVVFIAQLCPAEGIWRSYELDRTVCYNL